MEGWKIGRSWKNGAYDKVFWYEPGPSEVRHAVEPGASSSHVYSNEKLRRRDSFRCIYPLEFPLRLKDFFEAAPTTTFSGLCDICAHGYQREYTLFVRSPLWEQGMAMFMCTHALKAWNTSRTQWWREWRMACLILFMRYPAMKSAAQALVHFGRKWLIRGPEHILLMEIGRVE